MPREQDNSWNGKKIFQRSGLTMMDEMEFLGTIRRYVGKPRFPVALDEWTIYSNKQHFLKEESKGCNNLKISQTNTCKNGTQWDFKEEGVGQLQESESMGVAETIKKMESGVGDQLKPLSVWLEE